MRCSVCDVREAVTVTAVRRRRGGRGPLRVEGFEGSCAECGHERIRLSGACVTVVGLPGRSERREAVDLYGRIFTYDAVLTYFDADGQEHPVAS